MKTRRPPLPEHAAASAMDIVLRMEECWGKYAQVSVGQRGTASMLKDKAQETLGVKANDIQLIDRCGSSMTSPRW